MRKSRLARRSEQGGLRVDVLPLPWTALDAGQTLALILLPFFGVAALLAGALTLDWLFMLGHPKDSPGDEDDRRVSEFWE